MKIFSRRTHGIADYGIVVIFLSLPLALGFSGAPRMLSYSLAFFHLAITALSSFPPGGLPFLPYRIHVVLESLEAVFAILAPWIFRFSREMAPRSSTMVLGAVLLLIATFTDFDRRRDPAPRPPGDRRRWFERRSG